MSHLAFQMIILLHIQCYIIILISSVPILPPKLVKYTFTLQSVTLQSISCPAVTYIRAIVVETDLFTLIHPCPTLVNVCNVKGQCISNLKHPIRQ